MNDNRSGGKPAPLVRLLAVAAVLVFFFIRQNSENEDMKTPILVLIAAIFLFGFGTLIWQGIKEWKKTDEEILMGYALMATTMGTGNIRSSQGFQFLGAGFAATAYFLYNAWGTHAFTGACIFCGIALSIVAIPTLYTWYREKTAANSTPPEDHWITGEQITALLIGLVSCGFICFLIGVGFYHGVWWFILPPGLIFLFNFSRPLVAAIRTMIRPRQSKEQDPWDRPDIER